MERNSKTPPLSWESIVWSFQQHIMLCQLTPTEMLHFSFSNLDVWFFSNQHLRKMSKKNYLCSVTPEQPSRGYWCRDRPQSTATCSVSSLRLYTAEIRQKAQGVTDHWTAGQTTTNCFLSGLHLHNIWKHPNINHSTDFSNLAAEHDVV